MADRHHTPTAKAADAELLPRSPPVQTANGVAAITIRATHADGTLATHGDHTFTAEAKRTSDNHTERLAVHHQGSGTYVASASLPLAGGWQRRVRCSNWRAASRSASARCSARAAGTASRV